MEYVDNLKNILKINEYYYVPCLTKQLHMYLGNNTYDDISYKEIYPIINHKHTDKENGQNEFHYHIDDRFRFGKNSNTNYTYNYENINLLRISDSYIKDNNLNLEYVIMRCIKLDVGLITPVELIKNSKLKHKCIHKGKCPHRGYDLSNIHSINGIITCPLHGLKFNSDTKELITDQI